MTETNPLLATHAGLTPFDLLRAEHIEPAIDTLLAEAAAALEQAVDPALPASFEAVSAPLDLATERLGRAWGAVGHLNAVADTPAVRAAYNSCLPRVTEFYTRMGADERLYAKYKAIAAGPEAHTLSPARQQVLKHALRDFVLSGAELHGEQKTRFAAVQERLAALSQAFSEHVLDATDGYAHYVPLEALDGVPADAIEAARQAAAAEGRDDRKLTLHIPSYLPVMQYAHRRDLRETLYRAYVTRASDLGPEALDNSGIMAELLALRQEEAELLGYPHYAAVSLAPKMAQSADEVLQFLRDLARRARPYAERDMEALRDFARSELGIDDLQAWDQAYASERLKEARYAFSEQEVKQYFTEDRVLQGLFSIIETVFEVQIQRDTAPVWNEQVRFFRVERQGQAIAHFYLDPYARPGKRPGAWMDDARGRWQRPDGAGLQTPVAHLVCNFTPPLPGHSALLTHDDVITLFHEFGHGLHHMLTQISELGVAGISGVEWDAVELPSQFMENFCWEWEVLQQLTAHESTGAPLPRALYDKMMAAKNFQSGLQTLRQVEFALFDMQLHATVPTPAVLEVLAAVRAEVSVNAPPAFNRFPHAFSHIFAGGYAAGYYSYKWAEVLSADAWSAFEETSPLCVETGRRLRAEVFERGGSRPALENFTAFRGREPALDALLRHQGMAEPTAA